MNGTVRPVPLHVLTGFLGAGKTTLLAGLLRARRAERIAVLVNEIAELPIDPHLLERVDEGVFALPSGCICCSAREELLGAVANVLGRRPDRVVVETTGAADPGPILHALAGDERLRDRVALGGVVAVADVSRIESLLADVPEVRRQLALADRVVATRIDLTPPERLASARRLLAEAAPGCEVRDAPVGDADAAPFWAWLCAPAPLGGLRDAGDARGWLHHAAEAGPRLRAHSLQLEAPADLDAVQLWLRLVAQLDGERLLRIKLLGECAATGDLFALQSAGRAVSPPRRLAARPSGLRGVHAVLIERDLPGRALEQALAALRSAAAGRRPQPVAGAEGSVR